MEMEDSGVLGDVTLGTFDFQGNLTGPQRGESWDLEVEGAALHSASEEHICVSRPASTHVWKVSGKLPLSGICQGTRPE